MKWLVFAIAILCPLAVKAQTPITFSVDTSVVGPAVPADYVGLSFETSNVLPDNKGRYQFCSENTNLINLFRNIGIKNLRIGGGTVDIPRYAVPGQRDIDNLFGFAKAAGVRIIYSFRLLNGNKTNLAAIAGYIWQHYRSQLHSFSIGNEPDWRSYHNKDPKISDYPSFLADWNEFAAAIEAAAPGATLSGPDIGSNFPVPGATNTCFQGETWTQLFARDQKDFGGLGTILQHDYVGQNSAGVTAEEAVEAMLSRRWVTQNYPSLYEHVLAPVRRAGFDFRMTECNDYTGGVKGASDAFVAALWALDYMHWWAAHGCSGVNFHNKRWIFTDTIYQDSEGIYWIHPKAYALKAFDLGSHGNIMASVDLSNPCHVNVDCYAVGDAHNLYVTVINKTYRSAGETNIVATIRPEHFDVFHSEYMALESATPGDCFALEAKPLGGSPINCTEAWHGRWTPLASTPETQCSITIGPASAVIVHIARDTSSRR